MSECDHDGELPDDWTDQQRAVFNRIYRHMLASQEAFTHPAAPRVDDEHWNTTAWNTAWFAAHAVADDAPLIVHSIEDGTIFAAETPGDKLN